jgi:hypothetical protein
MRTFVFPVQVVVLLGALCAWTASTGASTPEDSAAALQHRDGALVALGEAQTALEDIETQLTKIKQELDYEYRALDAEVRRKNREEESKHRATIRSLKKKRDGLWVARDQARLVVSQREAESESAEALFRISELQTSGSNDSPQIQQLQKKHEKALARARRLQREIDAAERPAG